MTSTTLSLSRQLLLGEQLKRASHIDPHREAFIYKDQRLTYQQIDDRATHLAGWLQSNGINHNDKVGFIMKNSLAFAEVFFGIALSGGVGVPINFRLAAEEFKFIINNSDTKILIIDDDYADKIESIRDELPNVELIVTVGELDSESKFIHYDSIFEKTVHFTPCEKLTDEDPGMIVYTSGTTGRPKGAVLTHKNLIIDRLILLWEVGTPMHSRQLIVPPMFHVAAMAYLIRSCMVVGTSVIHRVFEPEKILQTLEKEKINTMFLVPSMWNNLLQVPDMEKYDLSSMQECSTGGAISPLGLKKKIMKVFKNASYGEAFGQTEMSPSATTLNRDDTIRKTDSVGRPILNVEIRVVDEEMNDVPVGEVGEIVYRGPTVMKEYYNNPEATKNAFKDGWFHSGDLVRVDEEGFVYIVDRKKDMIISGGENIYPAEIEEVLYTHPDILECAVVGFPDIDWGESVKAYIVLKQGKQLTEVDIIEFCKERLASYKKPKEVEFLDELPRNPSGKVLKTVLRDQLKENSKRI